MEVHTCSQNGNASEMPTGMSSFSCLPLTILESPWSPKETISRPLLEQNQTGEETVLVNNNAC